MKKMLPSPTKTLRKYSNTKETCIYFLKKGERCFHKTKGEKTNGEKLGIKNKKPQISETLSYRKGIKIFLSGSRTVVSAMTNERELR